MARSVWTGSVSFGLVHLPVRLFTATEEHDVAFHQMEAGTGRRIRLKRVAEGTGDEVPYDRIVKGYELPDGSVVELTKKELQAIDTGPTRTIELHRFVDAAEIDPVYYQRTYYVVPDGEGSARPFRLLLQVMQDSGRIGIGTFVMRAKQHLVSLRPYGKVLALETMHHPDDGHCEAHPHVRGVTTPPGPVCHCPGGWPAAK